MTTKTAVDGALETCATLGVARASCGSGTDPLVETQRLLYEELIGAKIAGQSELQRDLLAISPEQIAAAVRTATESAPIRAALIAQAEKLRKPQACVDDDSRRADFDRLDHEAESGS